MLLQALLSCLCLSILLVGSSRCTSSSSHTGTIDPTSRYAQANYVNPLLASAPPRGWNSYNSYSWIISEEDFLRNAQQVAEKLLPYGYEYVVVDFLWYRSKRPGASVTSPGFDVIDEWGRPIPDPVRWPSSAGGKGFKAIADQVHSLGLKFGIHVMRGISMQAVKSNTPILGGWGGPDGKSDHPWRASDIALQNEPCPWMEECFVRVNESTEGGQAYYRSLYNLYASWEVDFIKHDCVFGVDLNVDEIKVVSQAILESGRPMIYSVSPGVRATPDMALKVNGLVNMYRVTSDDWDSWWDLKSHFDVARDFAAAGLINASSLGGFSWPDLDMLPLGYLTDPGSNEGPHRFCKFSLVEQKTQMTLWAISKSPIMFGGDMLNIDQTTLSILTNPKVLSINAYSVGNMEMWSLSSQGMLASEAHKPCALTGINIDTSADKLQQNNIRIWRARAPSGNYFVAFFNLGPSSIIVSLSIECITQPSAAVVPSILQFGIAEAFKHQYQCTGQEIWNSQDIGTVTDVLSTEVPSHGCSLFELKCQCKNCGLFSSEQ